MDKEHVTEEDRLRVEVKRLKSVNASLHMKCIALSTRVTELEIVVDNYWSIIDSKIEK